MTAAALRKAEMMDETIEEAIAPRPWRHNAVSKAFGEDTLLTPDGFAAETADSYYLLHRSSRQKQVRDPATNVETAAIQLDNFFKIESRPNPKSGLPISDSILSAVVF
jgi:hypothetical protein